MPSRRSTFAVVCALAALGCGDFSGGPSSAISVRVKLASDASASFIRVEQREEGQPLQRSQLIENHGEGEFRFATMPVVRGAQVTLLALGYADSAQTHLTSRSDAVATRFRDGIQVVDLELHALAATQASPDSSADAGTTQGPPDAGGSANAFDAGAANDAGSATDAGLPCVTDSDCPSGTSCVEVDGVSTCIVKKD